MSSTTSKSTGYNKRQILFFMLILAALFAVGFSLSRILSASTNAVPEPAATTVANANPGGVGVVSPPKRLQDFTLTSKSGDPISLSDLRGRTVALFFGYTHCPDVCPLTLADYIQVKRMLGEQADDVAFVFVSVDGRRDTPEQMAAFLNQFDEDFVGMTGDEESLRMMGAEYGLAFSAEQISLVEDEHEDGTTHEHSEHAAPGEAELDQENYFVQHTSPSFLIDRNGFLRMVAFYRTEPTILAERLQELLQEPAQ